MIEGEADAQGVFKARYQAEAHGAEETLWFEVKRPATPTDPELRGESVEKPLLIAIPDLVRITRDNAPLAFADGGTCRHSPDPHWLTPSTRTRVMTLAAVYHLRTGRLLSLNDASLPLGGVLATNRITVAQEHKEDGMPRCHGSHRQGIDIDFNEDDRQVGDPGSEAVGENIRIATVDIRGESRTLLEYLDLVAERLGGTDYHTDESIHYRFPD